MKKAIMAFAFYSGMTSGMVETSMDDVCKRSLSPISMKNFKNKKMKLSEIEFIKDMGNFRHFDPPFMTENRFSSAQLTDTPSVVDNEEQYSQEQIDQLFKKYINWDQVDQSREKIQIQLQQWLLVWKLKQLNELNGENFIKACQFGTYFPNLRKLTINVEDFSNIRENKVTIPRLAELKVIGQISNKHEFDFLLSMLKKSLMKLEINVKNLQYFQTINLRELKELKISGSSMTEEELKKLERTNAHLSTQLKQQSEKVSVFLMSLRLSLKMLDFSDARLVGKSKKLTNSVGKLLGLTYLNLSKNKITAIPKSLKNLKNLNHLNFSDNKVKIGVPEWMASLSNLTHLDLSRNNISSISKTIEAFQKLTYLNLSLNYITQLPDYIWNLGKLSHLDLSGNNISRISPTIRKAKNLTYLDVANNRITELPESIGNLRNLIHLDLFGNKNVKFLPKSIFNLSNLRYLDVRCTSIVPLSQIQWWTWLSLRSSYIFNSIYINPYLYPLAFWWNDLNLSNINPYNSIYTNHYLANLSKQSENAQKKRKQVKFRK